MVLGPDGQKMSKSRGNVIAPDDVVGRYGADTVRSYLMFMGPFDQGGPWSNQGIEGVARFMNRVWALVTDATEAGAHDDAWEEPVGAALGVERLRNKAIARVTADYEGLRFNTALAALMEDVNALNKAREETPEIVADAAFSRAVDTLLILLAPMAPHLTEELWHERRLRAGMVEAEYTSIHIQPWPAYDPALIVDETVTIVVQVNGKVRDKLDLAPDVAEDEVRELALASAKVQSAMDGRALKKFIYVPGRLVSVVV
jgi:leucyl-tRNA synthetase